MSEIGPTLETHFLRRWARRILAGDLPMPDGTVIKARQVTSVEAGDDEALALWSRVRWRWVLAEGRAEVTGGP